MINSEHVLLSEWSQDYVRKIIMDFSRYSCAIVPCFDSCHLIITWTYVNSATLLFFKVWDLDVRAYVRTDSHVRTKIFEIDGLPNFLRYGAPLARLRRAGAPLLK